MTLDEFIGYDDFERDDRAERIIDEMEGGI
jgi:hypothetical protein